MNKLHTHPMEVAQVISIEADTTNENLSLDGYSNELSEIHIRKK